MIREARPADFDEIHAVVAAAFKSDVEADLVRRLRTEPGHRPALELVAEGDGAIVGHVLVGDTELHDGDTVRTILSLAPLAVRPDRQGDGIGSALVREVAARADALGEPLIVLQGSPVYYARFGFRDSRTFGIELPLPDWAPKEAGQVLPLRSYDPAIRGTVVYPPAFEGVD